MLELAQLGHSSFGISREGREEAKNAVMLSG
jgi:hypothetical protein